MLLEIRFFSLNDVFLVPLCLVIMYAIIRGRANANKDEGIRRYYYYAFYYKIVFVFFYVLVTEFYFGGGDTGLYYQGVQDLRAAVEDDFSNLGLILSTSSLNNENPLAPYFLYDNYSFDITFGYMRAAGNFFIPRLGFFFSYIFFNSYLCLCFCFAMFALGGAIRLFKTFYYYYPSAKRELALATFFLPSVTFWSAGFLKDPICFGAVGFIVYGVLNVFIRKQKIGASIFWIVAGSYLLFTIKTYIFLVLVVGLTIWIFAETNKMIKDRTLRQIFALMTFTVSMLVGYFLLQYFTSEETMQQYQVENIVSSAESQRSNYTDLERSGAGSQTSYYQINAANPVLLVVNSIGATFFRPFPWEVRSFAAVLSAIEALLFLYLTLNLFLKLGLIKPFRLAVKEPRILFCLVFAMIFALGVGASTANFGSLSRYKIPCMPFYLILVLLLYRSGGIQYPKFLRNLLARLFN